MAVTFGGLTVASAVDKTPSSSDSSQTPRPQGVDGSGRPLQPGGRPADSTATVSAGPPISRSEILARAQAWLTVPVSYSQSAFRDGYRTDCSGYVSMAWKTNRNYWTGDLNTIGTAIAYNDLRPGDMLLYHNPANPVNGSHVVLFDRWVSGVGGDFFIYEQTPPHTMHRRWSEAGYRRVLFKPYRYVNATEGGASLSGDARDDLVALDVNGEVRAFPNIDGMNFNWGTPRVVANGWLDPGRTVFADLDGDGRDDLIALDVNGEVRAFPNIDGMNFNWGTPRVVANGWLDPQRLDRPGSDGVRRSQRRWS